MDIRRAIAKDIDALLVLNNQIGQYHFENAPHSFTEPTEADRDFLLSALNDEARLFLVAESQDEVIGFITAVVTQNETVPFLVKSPICRIGTLVVNEKHRTKGVGTQLMVACQDWAGKLGAKQIRLEVMSFNEDAQNFYNRLGFNNQSHIMSKQVG